MAKSDFHDYAVYDLLADIEGITSRAMFGGYGLYKDGTIFGIIADDALYLKVDETNRNEYESFGSRPFAYSKGDGKTYEMSYWILPEEILEDRSRLEKLVFQSTAINASKRKSTKKRR